MDAERVAALRRFVVDERGPEAILDELLDERDEVLALLSEVEWGTENLCPVCWDGEHGFRPDHASDCRLAAMLRANPLTEPRPVGPNSPNGPNI